MVDIGSASGAIAIDWALSSPNRRSIAVERDPRIADLLAENVRRTGARVDIVLGEFDPAHLPPVPCVVWIGCISTISPSDVTAIMSHIPAIGLAFSHHNRVEPDNARLVRRALSSQYRVIDDGVNEARFLLAERLRAF